MSSTNRANAKERHTSDYYVTPVDCIKHFLSVWLEDLRSEYWDDTLNIGDRPDRALWLDPCAGGDKYHKMSYPSVIEEELGVEHVDTIDIREDSLADIKEDFFSQNIKDKYDVVITNPPFNQAQQIIEKSLDSVVDGGYVIMLLRLNFFGSQQRKIFWDKQLPVWSYVHHKRMSFTDDGKTDSIEYMHAVFVKNYSPSFTMLKII